MRIYTDLAIPRGSQHPREGSSQKWMKCMDQTLFSQSPFPGLFDHFITAWRIETTNLICQIIDFQGTCHPFCYCILLLRPQIWIDSHKAPSLARSQKLHLGCLFMHCRQEHNWELGGALTPGTSLRLAIVPLATLPRANTLKMNPCHSCSSGLYGWRHCLQL